MMQIEIRNDSVLIDGYVNAVERYSKVLRTRRGKFVEKIAAGAFQRALDRASRTGYAVKVLLNHDYGRELSSTADETTRINEDSIGLRCRCEIRDADVIQKAKNEELVGWSFGFIPLKETSDDAEIPHREVRELELREVSILDNTKKPAYDGTSIEVREEDEEDFIEVRFFEDEISQSERILPQKADLSAFERRYLATRAGF